MPADVNAAAVHLPRGIAEGELLWTPAAERVQRAHVEHFRCWLEDDRGVGLADYGALQRWSVQQPEAFWAAIWDYFDVQSDTPYLRVLDARRMPGARWFEGSQVNYAEHLLRAELRHAEATAIHHSSELREPATLTWGELGRQVRIVATQLRVLGIGPGDHVAAYMPNIPETAIAMMATTAIGAVWSAASPEFGARAVVDRFTQVRPKLLFTVDGYRFAGQDFARHDAVSSILAGLDGIEHVVWLPYLEPHRPPPMAGMTPWSSLLDHEDVPLEAFRYTRVAWDHPLWVLFSSGTTGLPKAIVHSHVGVLVEHLKLLAFHLDVGADSRVLFYSTTGWMMWNVLVASLLHGATAVMYDGCPIGPDPSVLWKLVERARVTALGVSPTYVQIMQKHGVVPRARFDLSALDTVLLAGSPSLPDTFAWFYDNVNPDLWVSSQSGGTEVVSAFVAASPTLPVYAGEIQARGLGMDVDVWDEQGKPVVDDAGELVVTSPAPSMPLRFCNDPDGARYREAYFSSYDQSQGGVWRHGDSCRVNARGGFYIYGRSDSLLNRYGVCIGTAEIYRSVERVDGVLDSIIVCCELAGGRFFMPMFLKLRSGATLDEALRNRIARQLRADCSPRHVPDQLYVVDEIPYTLTGKKMEVPVRKILTGWSLEKTASRDAMLNPEAIDWFVKFRADNRAMLTG